MNGSEAEGGPQPPASGREAGGCVYLLRAVGTGHYLISRSLEPLPAPVEVVHRVRAEDPEAAAQFLHLTFADRHRGGEWFALTAGDVAWLTGLHSIDTPPAEGRQAPPL